MSILKESIKDDFYKSKASNRGISRIRKLFDLTNPGEYTIDDITWDDLEMDDVFYELDRTYTSCGEAVLYNILRNPLMSKDDIHKRGEIVDSFIQNQDLTTEIRLILFKLGYDKKNYFLDMLNGLMVVKKYKYLLYRVLGLIIPSIIVLFAILFKDPRFMSIFMVVALINVGISQTEKGIIQGNALNYLSDLIKAGKRISKIDNNLIKDKTEIIKDTLNSIKEIDRGTLLIKIMNIWGGLLEMLAVPFLIEESVYYKISSLIDKDKAKIYKLYYLIGEIDSLISIASYKESNRDKLSNPNFIEDKELIIVKGIHPLLKNPVTNDIKINKKGIVLTGTNMSGKSTFLRMVGTNILLAQTFNMTFTEKYEGCFFNIISSISPKDDIRQGKSYYMAEAESLLRIIKAINKEITVFSPIDEIFRGTNPIERIAASAEILSYINKHNAKVIVATHDREITEMLNDKYDFYYFSENISEDKGLNFDYKLKKGISKTRNAIRLLEYMNYPQEIIKESYKTSYELEEKYN